MTAKSKYPTQTDRQAGLGSIIVTMIIMIVLSLVVLGAAQLSRRNQRQTLDRQLNTQAFYAAESGVNDALNALKTSPALMAGEYTTNCAEFMSPANANLNGNLDGTNNIKYTCLFVDPTPTNWEGDVSDTSSVIPLVDDAGGPITSVTISWQSVAGGDNDFTGCVQGFEPVATRAATTCRTPVLRFDLVPTVNVTRAALNASTMTGFLLPDDAGGSTLAYDTIQKARTSVTCNAATVPRACRLQITGLGSTSYHLHIRSLYGTASVHVIAENGATPVELKGAQVVVDSTGKAADILRRIQVRVPFDQSFDVPDFAILSGETICKQLLVSGATATTANADPACQP